MAEPTALLIGARDEALLAILVEAGLQFAGASSTSPDLVLAPLDNGETSLAEARRSYPNAEFLVLAPAERLPEARLAARSLGADVIVLPADRRRTLEVLRAAVERRRERERGEALVERVRRLDPELAAEVEELAALAQHRARALDEARRLRSAFVANISHEIRTPATVLQGMVEVLSEDLRHELAPDQIDLIERIRAAAEDLVDLVQCILDFAKAEAGVVEVRPVPVYVPDLVADLERTTEPLLRGKPVRLVVERPRELEWIATDRPKLEQLLRQLLSNAAKFTERGEIRLRFGFAAARPEPADDPVRLLRAPVPRGDFLEIVVADTGPGIPEAARETIFEAFRQLDDSLSREHEGLGLGLALVRHLARVLGASLRLETRPGAGTRFTVELPLTALPTPESRPPQRPAAFGASRPRLEPRGFVAEWATLLRTPVRTREDAIRLALDFADRLLASRSSLYAERAPSGWIVVEAFSRGGARFGPGDPVPFPVEGAERAQVAEMPGEGGTTWRIAGVSADGELRGVIGVECPAEAEPEEARRLLTICGRWLGLELQRLGLAEERAEILAWVGRDVKTPLGTLLAYTQSLLRGLCGPLSPQQRSVVLRLERALHRVILSALDLLDYHRAAERRLSGAPNAFSLERVVDHVLSRHAAAIEVGNFRILKAFPPDLPPCFGDEIRTDRAISNLLRALLERLPDSSEIRIRGFAGGDSVGCEISAAPSDLALFLDGLARDAGRPEIGETLGLRLTRAGIESQGGRVELLQGAQDITVQLSLPVRRAG
jgi:signal transduction histidine kinase